MNVRWSRRTLAELREVYEDIAQDSPARAAATVGRRRSATRGLEQFPRLGRRDRLTGTRELAVARTPYVIIYRIDDVVTVASVRHGAQRWPE